MPALSAEAGGSELIMGKADRGSAGRSGRVPYRPGEDPGRRHERRKECAAADVALLLDWCERHEFTVTRKNEGHHWIIVHPTFRAEWWPSSAKLVFDQCWEHGIHCHDVEQVIQQLSRRLPPVTQATRSP